MSTAPDNDKSVRRHGNASVELAKRARLMADEGLAALADGSRVHAHNVLDSAGSLALVSIAQSLAVLAIDVAEQRADAEGVQA